MQIIPIINSNSSSSRFGLNACKTKLADMQYGIEHYPNYPETMTPANCVCESVVIVVSLMVFAALLYSLIWHICIQLQKTTHWIKVLKSLKIQVFFFMNMVCFSQIVHYTMSISRNNRTQLSIFEVIIKNIGMFLVVYFVFKKATKPLGHDEKKLWLRRLRIIFFTNLLLNGLFVAMIEIQVFNFKNIDDQQIDLKDTWNQQFEFENVLCTSEFWLINSMAEILQIILFVFVTQSITKQVNQMIEYEKKVYGYREGHFQIQLKKINNLWLIISVYGTINLYVFLFTLTSFSWSVKIHREVAN